MTDPLASDDRPTAAEIVVIGAGPTASSLLERIVANVPVLLPDCPVRIHLVDPERAGIGRVWRADNHARLWMNSLAEDVTMFTDGSVSCDGPIWPGPSLYEWAHTVDTDELHALADDALVAEIRTLRGTTFPTRRVQTVYLEWFHRRVLAALPCNAEVVTHRRRAIDLVDDADGRQVVTLEDGTTIVADVVVLALGHLDAEPDGGGRRFADGAARHGLAYLPPAHTAELDLSALRAGEDVISLGFGQAFTDLVVLVTEGRGGRFVDRGDGTLRYDPSGDEPVLHVGSRRGVPYRSKLDYRLKAPRVPLPRFLDNDSIERLLARPDPLDFRRDVLPIVEKEVGWAFYYELFHGHEDRVATTWWNFADQFAGAATREQLRDVVAAAVPAVADRFDIEALDRPLAGRRFADADAAHRFVRDHVAADVARRTDTTFSADLGAFNGLLSSFAAVGRIAASGRMDERSRVEDVGGWWFSFFMYFASGPPPARLRQLLALEEAGLVRFIGAGTSVKVDEALERFVATSDSHDDQVVASTLIDARVAPSSVSRTRDRLLASLRDRGEVAEEVVADGRGWTLNTGKVVVGGHALQVVHADGTRHARRHALGTFTSRPAAGAFARPRTNAPSFRQNDTVARAILGGLAAGNRRPAVEATA
jgi:uncharacterized NAD(P)/FAD-binding protein YdhS